jgi:hypothetical protein
MKTLITMFAMTVLVASPASGSIRDAAFASSADRQGLQTSMFAGATYGVDLDKRTGQARGRASLGFGGMTRTPTADLRFAKGLQLSAGQTGKPALFVGGRDLGQVQKQKANLSGGTTALIVVGVVALVAVAAVVVADAVDDERCIGEDGDCD